jgi:hypothetical protein
MSDQKTLTVNIDSLLDGTLDDLADFPEFKPFPVGVHRCQLSFEQKIVNKHPAFQVNLKALETVELPSGSEDKPLEAGAETSVLYMLDNEMGQGKFKQLLSALRDHFGAKSNRELIAEATSAEILVSTELRSNKEKTKQFTDIVAIQVV